MNPVQLRAFHLVAREGGFTRAAAAAKVSQPTLSSHVAALEAAYAVRLFERRGRALELTALGRDLHDVTTRLAGLGLARVVSAFKIKIRVIYYIHH